MADPHIASRQPIQIRLDSGEHFWCACGHSKTQPFCDGSHEGKGIEPLAFKVDYETKKLMCQCKHTKTPPYCDGSHRYIEVE